MSRPSNCVISDAKPRFQSQNPVFSCKRFRGRSFFIYIYIVSGVFLPCFPYQVVRPTIVHTHHSDIPRERNLGVHSQIRMTALFIFEKSTFASGRNKSHRPNSQILDRQVGLNPEFLDFWRVFFFFFFFFFLQALLRSNTQRSKCKPPLDAIYSSPQRTSLTASRGGKWCTKCRHMPSNSRSPRRSSPSR